MTVALVFVENDGDATKKDRIKILEASIGSSLRTLHVKPMMYPDQQASHAAARTLRCRIISNARAKHALDLACSTEKTGEVRNDFPGCTTLQSSKLQLQTLISRATR